jgi:predicted RNA-binding Zn-ribbon protein involved in translation (DUF1610 family)
MEKLKPEDTIIFLAISQRSEYSEQIIDYINNFFEFKSEIDPSDRYNIITFNKNGIVYFQEFTYYSKELQNFISKVVPEIANVNLLEGISLAMNLFTEVFKVISGRIFRLLIVTDEKTEHLEISEDTWEFIKYMGTLPLSIDILRIGIYDLTEDKKLKRFIEPTGGTMYYYDNEEDAIKIMKKLIEKKDFKSSKLSTGELKVTDFNRGFIDFLAADLMRLPEIADEVGIRCQICGKPNNLYECPQCGTTSHQECLAHWANYSLIGEILPNVFRCQNCFRLLRIDIKVLWDSQSNPEIDEDTEMFLHNTYVLGDMNKEEILYEETIELPNIITEKQSYNEMKIPEFDEVQEYVVWDDEEDEQIVLIKCPNCGKFLTNEYKFCIECGQKI